MHVEIPLKHYYTTVVGKIAHGMSPLVMNPVEGTVRLQCLLMESKTTWQAVGQVNNGFIEGLALYKSLNDADQFKKSLKS